MPNTELTTLPHILLYEPEIPPNTGNIIRLCANTGALLHLIEPMGFVLDDKRLRRAGLDYHEWANVKTWSNLAAYRTHYPEQRLLAIETGGQQRHTDVSYSASDTLILGPETRGLPQTLLDELPPDQIVRLPMLPGRRSLNLSNATAIVVYEAWRQLGFNGTSR